MRPVGDLHLVNDLDQGNAEREGIQHVIQGVQDAPAHPRQRVPDKGGHGLVFGERLRRRGPPSPWARTANFLGVQARLDLRVRLHLSCMSRTRTAARRQAGPGWSAPPAARLRRRGPISPRGGAAPRPPTPLTAGESEEEPGLRLRKGRTKDGRVNFMVGFPFKTPPPARPPRRERGNKEKSRHPPGC